MGMLPVLCSAAQEASLQEKVSLKASSCSGPRVAVNAEQQVFFVWEGLLEGRSRIFFRGKNGPDWEPETILDGTEWGDNTEPSITLDDHGNPYVVWTFHDQECSSVYYTFRLRNSWVQPVLLRQSGENNCEFADIAVQPGTNRIFVTWQEGRGSRYAIYAATQDKGGKFVTEQVSAPEHAGFNSFPQMAIAPTPFLTWYGSGESDFLLHAALFDLQTEHWMRYEPSGLERLPANRLPFLMPDEQGTLFAVWYDSDGATDRIYFRRQGDASSDKGLIVDGNPERMNNLPMGVVSLQGRVFICWRGESLFGGQIFLTSGEAVSGSEFQESQLISDGQKLFYTEPDCAPDPQGGVAVVWASSALDGGDGSVYYRHVKP